MRGNDWVEKLSSWASSGRQASRAMEELAAELRSLSVPAVPVEDGGNRDTESWTVPRWDAQLSLSSPAETGQRDKDNLLSLVRTGTQFFDGTRWRTVRPRLYVAQGHP